MGRGRWHTDPEGQSVLAVQPTPPHWPHSFWAAQELAQTVAERSLRAVGLRRSCAMSNHCIGAAVVYGAERRGLYSLLEYAIPSLWHWRAWSLYCLQRPSDRKRRCLHMDGGILAVPRSMELVMSGRGYLVGVASEPASLSLSVRRGFHRIPRLFILTRWLIEVEEVSKVRRVCSCQRCPGPPGDP